MAAFLQIHLCGPGGSEPSDINSAAAGSDSAAASPEAANAAARVAAIRVLTAAHERTGEMAGAFLREFNVEAEEAFARDVQRAVAGPGAESLPVSCVIFSSLPEYTFSKPILGRGPEGPWVQVSPSLSLTLWDLSELNMNQG